MELIEEAVQNVMNKLRELPVGTETSIGRLLSDGTAKYSLDEETKISCMVFEKCKEENIILDFSKYVDQKTGLIQNIPFIKK